MYNALTIAKYVVNFCLEHHSPISNLQLQKMLYFIQRECIGWTGRTAFRDNIVAWKLGPVVTEVYSEFSPYAGRPILRDYPEVDIDDEQIRAIVEQVALRRMGQSAWDLVNETHREGSPWNKVYSDGYGSGEIIPLVYIEEDYEDNQR